MSFVNFHGILAFSLEFQFRLVQVTHIVVPSHQVRSVGYQIRVGEVGRDLDCFGDDESHGFPAV